MSQENAPNSGFSIRDGDRGIGDVAKVSLELRPIGDEIEPPPCDFCSTTRHEPNVMERGFVEADYRLVNTYGVLFGYTCHDCIQKR